MDINNIDTYKSLRLISIVVSYAPYMNRKIMKQMNAVIYTMVLFVDSGSTYSSASGVYEYTGWTGIDGRVVDLCLFVTFIRISYKLIILYIYHLPNTKPNCAIENSNLSEKLSRSLIAVVMIRNRVLYFTFISHPVSLT